MVTHDRISTKTDTSKFLHGLQSHTEPTLDWPCSANLEILPYGLHFSEVMSFTKIIKVMGNICSRLLQGNGAITRVLAYCKILAR